MLNKNAPIGVLDSGVGGLSVLKCLKELLPNENFIYLGDTARTPYGPRSEKEVRQFVGEMLDYFETQSTKLVVIACNTLTVLGVDTLKGNHKFDIVGMSKGAKLVLNASNNKTIGVFATEFTINSGAHKAAIMSLDSSAIVVPKACPRFVPLIEGEKFGSSEIADAVAEYAAPVKNAGVDTLILSCTHYPFIKKEIEHEMGDQVKVIDVMQDFCRKVLWAILPFVLLPIWQEASVLLPACSALLPVNSEKYVWIKDYEHSGCCCCGVLFVFDFNK